MIIPRVTHYGTLKDIVRFFPKLDNTEKTFFKTLCAHVEIPQSQISFFRIKVTTFTCLQLVDYDHRKAAKKSGHPVGNLHLSLACLASAENNVGPFANSFTFFQITPDN